MSRIKKKYLRSKVLFIVILVFSLNVTVFAGGLDDLGKIVDGSLLTEERESQMDLQNPVRGNILNQGTARLSDKGGGSVNVYGAVFGSVVCDKLILKITLQRYENGRWVNVEFFEDTAYNDATLSKSYNVSVKKGYYYRNKAACVAQKGSTTETKAPITDGIWID